MTLGVWLKGSRFSGQPGAVVVDSYTAREWRKWTYYW